MPAITFFRSEGAVSSQCLKALCGEMPLREAMNCNGSVIRVALNNRSRRHLTQDILLILSVQVVSVSMLFR